MQEDGDGILLQVRRKTGRGKVTIGMLSDLVRNEEKRVNLVLTSFRSIFATLFIREIIAR